MHYYQNDVAKLVKRAAKIVAPIFKKQGWEWCSTAGVPKKSDIAATYQYLVDRVLDSERWEFGPIDGTGTGRLYVGASVDENGKVEEVTLYLDLGTVWPDGEGISE